MFDGDDRRHTVSDVRACEVRILLLQDPQFPGILVNDCGKGSLEPGQMGSAFRVIDIVTESQDIFMEFIDILERHFHFDAIGLAFEIYGFVDGFLLGIEVFYES